ncbi:hypothetical protein PHG25ORF071c [Aeromonas phage 25]|uniref:Uncharacterized protein n=1 Tax=Aeromonas phage 25 TaxID=2911441 RepID=Q19CU5_9CAUD|nr:hypothetical protein PHG25ORF071c [Aeromonas phage 25]ABF72630.1 hypothetical protein PHG25ORF071c [Aeromonas phage 25]
MIKAAEMAKMVAQNSTEIVNSVSVHFDDFFNDNMKDTMRHNDCQRRYWFN